MHYGSKIITLGNRIFPQYHIVKLQVVLLFDSDSKWKVSHLNNVTDGDLKEELDVNM